MNTPRIVVLAVLMALGGCAAPVRVGPSSPEPRVSPQVREQIGRLQLSDSIPDRFELSGHDVAKTKVRGWRTTLRAGFAAAFGSSSAPSVLHIDKAELTFVRQRTLEGHVALASRDDSRVLLAHGGLEMHKSGMPPRKTFARIDYAARVVDPDGHIVTASGSVLSAALADDVAATTAVKMAVETMYEKIASDVMAKTNIERGDRSETNSRAFAPSS